MIDNVVFLRIGLSNYLYLWHCVCAEPPSHDPGIWRVDICYEGLLCPQPHWVNRWPKHTQDVGHNRPLLWVAGPYGKVCIISDVMVTGSCCQPASTQCGCGWMSWISYCAMLGALSFEVSANWAWFQFLFNINVVICDGAVVLLFIYFFIYLFFNLFFLIFIIIIIFFKLNHII